MFVRTFTVQRRDAGGVDVLTGCVLKRLPDGAQTTLEASDEWAETLHDVFGVDLPRGDRDRLWARVRAAHETWLAGQ